MPASGFQNENGTSPVFETGAMRMPHVDCHRFPHWDRAVPHNLIQLIWSISTNWAQKRIECMLIRNILMACLLNTLPFGFPEDAACNWMTEKLVLHELYISSNKFWVPLNLWDEDTSFRDEFGAPRKSILLPEHDFKWCWFLMLSFLIPKWLGRPLRYDMPKLPHLCAEVLINV